MVCVRLAAAWLVRRLPFNDQQIVYCRVCKCGRVLSSPACRANELEKLVQESVPGAEFVVNAEKVGPAVIRSRMREAGGHNGFPASGEEHHAHHALHHVALWPRLVRYTGTAQGQSSQPFRLQPTTHPALPHISLPLRSPARDALRCAAAARCMCPCR